MSNKEIVKLSRRTFVVGAAGITAAVLFGCSDDSQSNDDQNAVDSQIQPETSVETQTIIDMEGTEVVLPYDLKNVAITSWKGAIGVFVLFGEYKRIKICCDTSRYRWLCHALPELATLPDFGSFDEISLEEMMQAKPDVIISPEQAANATKQLRNLGLAVVVDGATPKDSQDTFATAHAERELIAQMLHTEDLLEKYNKWSDSLMQEVESRVADIPDESRKKVLVTRTNMEEVFCENINLGHSATLAGGILVTEGMTDYYTTVDTEQIVQWNPDVIFQQIVTIDQDTMSGIYREWQNDERYKNINAIQSGDVYIIPMGITQWSGDVESALGILLMAKQMYPEKFEDMDVLEYAKEFYSEFMQYDLGEDDYKYLFVDMDGAKPLGIIK